MSTSSTGVSKSIPALKKCPNAKVVAIASRDPQRAAAVARDHGIPTSYGCYEDLLKDDRVDAVYMPLPNSMHMEWVIRAAQAGKAILCEKPAALTVADAIEMETACSACNVTFMEGFHYRFHPQFETVRRWLLEGSIGKVRSIHASFSFLMESRHSRIRLSSALGGGAIADVGSYAVDLCQWLSGLLPIKAFAWTGTSADADAETNFAALLQFPDGVRASIDGSFDQARHCRCELIGELGSISISSPFLPVDGASIRLQVGQISEQTTFTAIDTFQLQFGHFSNCLLHRQPPMIPFGESVTNAQTLAALQSSLAHGVVAAI